MCVRMVHISTYLFAAIIFGQKPFASSSSTAFSIAVNSLFAFVFTIIILTETVFTARAFSL